MHISGTKQTDTHVKFIVIIATAKSMYAAVVTKYSQCIHRNVRWPLVATNSTQKVDFFTLLIDHTSIACATIDYRSCICTQDTSYTPDLPSQCVPRPWVCNLGTRLHL